MTTYHDYHWSTDDAANLLPVLAMAQNILGPVAGREDVLGSDPARYYLSVRAEEVMAVPAGMVDADQAILAELVGVWA